jgi:hypothetical protein
LEKKVASLEKIFSIDKNIFSITKNMVENDRRYKLFYCNDLIVVREDGRKDDEDVLAAFDLILCVKVLSLGDEADGRKPSDYLLYDRKNGPHIQDNLLVREEHGRRNREHLLPNGGYLLYFRDLGRGLEEDWLVAGKDGK